MTNAYSNMSAPPRSRIQKVVRPVGRQVAFNFEKAGLQEPGADLYLTFAGREELYNDWLIDYASRHKAELEAVRRPAGFMVGSVCEAILGPPKDTMKRYPDLYHVCTDPILTVAILGRMAGLLYVPRRELRLANGDFSRTIAFPAKFFPQFSLVP
ncbi:MAG: hypothetical protein ACI4RD_05495 [Kiritimatiellia bacterium]